jgi:UDP-N-acetyl-D-glucosamine dehydrogenase
MHAVVVALGKVGLPLAARIALAGHNVVGADVPRVVDLVNAGEAPFPNEAGLPEALAATIADGRLRAVRDTAAAVAEGPDLVVAVPPLVVDASARPDWGILDAVVADIGRGLKAGTTVSIETTVPVGTTRARVAPALEAASGLREGADFHLIFSPERIFSGRAIADLDKYPKLVGGLSPAGEARGIELYASFLDAEVRGLGSAEAAELSKLAETTYRDINIAFANELARYADTLGIDVLSVIDAANSQPYSHVHRPGIAVGGHCIPVYPRFLLAGDPDARLPSTAREINEQMPAYAADLLGDVDGQRVLILGVAYRGGVKETAFSGAFALRDALAGRGATVLAADPMFNDDELRGHGFAPWDGTSEINAAVLQADHVRYATLAAADLPGVTAIVDGRGVLNAANFPGIPVRRIGRPEGSAQDPGSSLAPRS